MSDKTERKTCNYDIRGVSDKNDDDLVSSSEMGLHSRLSQPAAS